MDLKNLNLLLSQLAEEKKISKEKVLESVEAAIASAYKKEYGRKSQIIKAKLDFKTGEVRFWQVKIVVNKEMIYSEEELKKLKSLSSKEKDSIEKKIKFNPDRHILLEEAERIKPGIKVNEELKIPLKSAKSFGRIASQTAKQVIIQKIREAEKEAIYEEFKAKEGEVVSGIIQRIEGKNIYFNLGRTLGILPREEQIPGEFYRVGQRLKTYVLRVEQTSKGPMIILSRKYPKLVSKLFELEVLEIASGQVVIKSIAREAGSRTKIAVTSLEKGVDPIGAMVGQRGVRVQTVINELGGEKIDIIQYSDDPKEYIANALSPAKVLEVRILPKNKAVAIVPKEQLSLAISKDGQNVRLASQLTGWKIDVKSMEEIKEMEEVKDIEKKNKL